MVKHHNRQGFGDGDMFVNKKTGMRYEINGTWYGMGKWFGIVEFDVLNINTGAKKTVLATELKGWVDNGILTQTW